MTVRRWVAAGTLLVAFAATTGTAAAHPDDTLLDGSFELAGTRTVESPIHFHRLVGRVRSDRPVTVRVVNTVTGAVAFEEVVAGSARLNHLVDCCSGAGWTDFGVELSNREQAPATVEGRMSFVHDDLAVVVWREEGGFETPLLLVGVGAAMVWAARRRRDAETARRRRRRAAAVAAGTVAAVVGLSVLGRVRYGGDAVEGLVASVADVIRFPTGSFFSGLAVLMGVALVSWLTAGVLWSRGVPPEGPDSRWVALGVVFAAAPVAVAVMMARTYGTAGMPALLAASTAVPVLVAMGTARRPRSSR